MNIFDSIKNLFSFKPQKKGAFAQQIFANIEGTVANYFGISNKSEVKLYAGWVFACISAIAQEVATIKLGLFRKLSDGTKEPIENHPAMNLLNYVNNYLTYYTLFERLQSNIELCGNEYWLLSRGVNGKGDPQMIFPLIPWLVKPIAADNPLNYVKEYHYNLGGSTIEIPPEHIVHFKTYNPASDLTGFGTLQAAKASVVTDYEIKNFNAGFFEKKAMPGAVLKYNGKLEESQISKLKRQWEELYGGSGNSGKMLLLHNGLELGDVMKLSHSDMEFTEQQRALRDEILAIFRVSKIILGITEDVNRASAEAGIFTYIRLTILPKMKSNTAALNEFYLPKFSNTEDLVIELLNKPPDDRQTVINGYIAGLNNGFLTVNEIRRSEGLEEVEGGNQLYIPFGLQPIGQVVKQMQPQQRGGVKIAHTHDDLTSNLAKAVVELQNKKTSKKKIQKEGEYVDVTKPGFDEKGEARVKQIDDALVPYERKFEQIILNYFEQQKQRVIAAINQLQIENRQFKQNGKEILNPSTEIKIAFESLEPAYAELVDEMGNNAIAYIGVSTEFTPSKEVIKNDVKKLAGSMVLTTISGLDKILAEGIDAGESIPQLTQRVRTFTGFGKDRAQKIARTETIRASGKASIMAWNQSGVVEKKIWYTALDERVCEICMFLHGKVVSLNKVFLSAEGLVEIGGDPYDPLQAPPAHPQCRCTPVPVPYE